MALEIRHADAADLDSLAALEAAGFPPEEAAGRASLAARIQAYGNHFWLMIEEGRLVSFVDGMVTDEPDLTDAMYEDAAMHDEAGAWQMIFGVDTIPDYRRRGCAALLLRRAIADARAQGRRGLVLTCKERLIPYYARFGFEDEGVSEKTSHGGAVWHQMRLVFHQDDEK